MSDKFDFEKNTDIDDLTVIDATIEENRMNVLDSSLGDDDSVDDDIYDGYYDEKIDEPYYPAVKSVVFGAIAIIFPLFAWLFSLFNSMSLMAFAVAITGLVFGVVGFVATTKCGSAPRGSLSQGLARAGRCISIIGLVVSVVVLSVIFVNFLISVLLLTAVLLVYLIAGLAWFIAFIFRYM